MNHILKNNLSFILDGNFAEYPIQKENIERALSRGYDIEIIFVYRDKNVAKNYTKLRENIEGRVVSDDVFETKYIESIKTTKQILNEFENISFRFFDLSSMEIVKNQEGVDKLLKLYKTLDTKILIENAETV